MEQELFSLLCIRAGEKLSQREIAKILNVSPTTIGNSIKGLNDFVKLEKTKTINFISLNTEATNAIELKRAENLKQIYLSGLHNYIKDELAGSTIILFGSYSRGEDSFGSDIDIAVIGRKAKSLPFDKYSKILHRTISTNFYNSWKDIHGNLKNNILNGIILHGSVDL